MDAEYGYDSDSDGDGVGGGLSSDEEDDLGSLLQKSSAIGVRPQAEGASSSLRALEEEESFEDEVGKEFDAAFALVEHDAGIRSLPARVKKDPLYDPRMDARDEAWINARRRRYQPAAPASGLQKLPHSDAVLNCPCCMTMLCLDCQRHEKFSNQYRAMFVFNCKINFEETLKIPAGVDKRQLKKLKWKGRKRKLETPSNGGEGPSTSSARAPSPEASEGQACDDFHPVTCATCGTRVAVYDSDEVYHFFHVLASH